MLLQNPAADVEACAPLEKMGDIDGFLGICIDFSLILINISVESVMKGMNVRYVQVSRAVGQSGSRAVGQSVLIV